MNRYEETDRLDPDGIDCPQCDGVGRLPTDHNEEWVECGVCNGVAKVRRIE